MATGCVQGRVADSSGETTNERERVRARLARLLAIIVLVVSALALMPVSQALAGGTGWDGHDRPGLLKKAVDRIA